MTDNNREQMGRAQLKAPFPYFGGKSRVASLVWDALGDVPNYVEPFMGSGAVLLARPHEPQIETVNDLCGWLCNFWRAVKSDPDAVATLADWPVSELDLHSRGDWLFYREHVDEWIERLRAEPDYYDAKSAGWWVWGLCAWIGTGWGPRDAGSGIHRQRPHLGAGSGIHSARCAHLTAYMRRIAERLRNVRVCCGDWTRVMGPIVTVKHGLTGIFLDPPYGVADRDDCYNHDSRTVAHEVAAWAIANGDNPLLRIVMAGYEGEHAFPPSWRCVAWKAVGGFGSQGKKQGRANAVRERLWFSPHCLGAPDLISLMEQAL